MLNATCREDIDDQGKEKNCFLIDPTIAEHNHTFS